MRYLLTLNVMPRGSDEEIEIEEDEWRRLVATKRGLVVLVGLEEKFGMLMENWREFEQELLNQALRASMYGDLGFDHAQDIVYTAARRLSNVLASARSYIDQAKHDVASLRDDSETQDAVNRHFAQQYDLRLGYRVMEAVRNYALHRSVPLQAISLKHHSLRGRGVVTAAVPVLHLSELRSDRDFKKVVLDELASKGEAHQVAPLLRDYVEGIATAHDSIMLMFDDHCQEWDSTLEAAIARWKSAHGENVGGLVALQEDDDGRAFSEDLYDDLIARRKRLQRRKRRAKRLTRSFVSNDLEGMRND